MFAHLTASDLVGYWLVAGVAAGATALAFVAGRLSTGVGALGRSRRRAEVPPEG